MKKEEISKHSCRVTVRYKPEELKQVKKQFKNTTCRKISEYIRKTSLHKPVVITYRNQSADDFLSEMIQLKNELNAIGNNFNQTVKKLHTLNHLSEFKSWVMINESGRQILFKKIEEIKEKMNQIYQQWLQE
jgi:hypothetical protein